MSLLYASEPVQFNSAVPSCDWRMCAATRPTVRTRNARIPRTCRTRKPLLMSRNCQKVAPVPAEIVSLFM